MKCEFCDIYGIEIICFATIFNILACYEVMIAFIVAPTSNSRTCLVI